MTTAIALRGRRPTTIHCTLVAALVASALAPACTIEGRQGVEESRHRELPPLDIEVHAEELDPELPRWRPGNGELLDTKRGRIEGNRRREGANGNIRDREEKER
jgi:hypothetical protein